MLYKTLGEKFRVDLQLMHTHKKSSYSPLLYAKIN